jgi:hypothetical protein
LPDDPAGTRPVLREELLPEQLAQLGGDEPCHKVVAAAGPAATMMRTGFTGYISAAIAELGETSAIAAGCRRIGVDP